MRYSELFEKYILDTPKNGEYQVYKNPSRFNNVPNDHNRLRGLIDTEGNHWVWDAFKDVHALVGSKLGVEFKTFYVIETDISDERFVSIVWPFGEGIEQATKVLMNDVRFLKMITRMKPALVVQGGIHQADPTDLILR